MAPGSTGLLWLDNYSTPIPRRDPFVSSPLGSGAVGGVYGHRRRRE